MSEGLCELVKRKAKDIYCRPTLNIYEGVKRGHSGPRRECSEARLFFRKGSSEEKS